MPAPSSVISKPTRFAERQQTHALRWVAGLVLLCMLAQALLIPAQRINERTHFHLSSGTRNLTARSDSQSVARAVFAHRAAAHDEAAPHQHSALQAHSHEHDHGARADVVYVSGHDGQSTASPAAPSVKRLLLDQDGLWASALPVLVVTVARVAFNEFTPRVSTRETLPLERPPRA